MVAKFPATLAWMDVVEAKRGKGEEGKRRARDGEEQRKGDEQVTKPLA
jgi:hypothetical protein